MTNKPLTLEEFKGIYSKVPRLCVDLIISTPNGIVLTLRDLPDYNNMWHFPGGTVFYRERIEDAVARISKAEIGVEVEIVKFLGYMEFMSEVKERGYGYTVSLGILCFTKNEDLVVNEDASKVNAFKELPENVIAEQKEFLEKHWDLVKEKFS